jgi:opacity protein-like surface antigen
MNRASIGLVLAALVLAPAALADTPGEGTFKPAVLGDTSLRLDLSQAIAREASQPEAEKPPAVQRPVGYGLAGSQWWTIGAAYAKDFHEATDFNVHFDYSIFIADDLEFALEGAGWYFHQRGDDTGGVSASMLFRWHFLHPKDNHDWTVFGDVGIGLLFGFDEVPDGGTGFDFLPRVGIGFTKAFSDSVDGESRGPRWMVGVRYHHISNGRIASDSRNPARDAVCVYAAITFPF